jgi:hypothetical protein
MNCRKDYNAKSRACIEGDTIVRRVIIVIMVLLRNIKMILLIVIYNGTKSSQNIFILNILN